MVLPTISQTTSRQPLSSDPAPFWRTAAVVRNRCRVLNRSDIQAGRGHSAHGRLASRPRTADPHIHHTHAVVPPWLAALAAACCAAKGVPLRDPRKPSDPELFHETVFPLGSVMVTIVLLKEA